MPARPTAVSDFAAVAVLPIPLIVAAAPKKPPAEIKPKLKSKPEFPGINAPIHEFKSEPDSYPAVAVDAIRAPDEWITGMAINGNMMILKS